MFLARYLRKTAWQNLMCLTINGALLVQTFLLSMKTKQPFAFSILLLIIGGCNLNKGNNNTVQIEIFTDSVTNITADTLANGDIAEWNEIDYNNTKVLQTIFVTAREGTEMKQQKDVNSKSVGYYKYGSKVDVIETGEEWIGVREYILREFFKEGNKIKANHWEKVYVLKSSTGDLNNITLAPSDLPSINSLKFNRRHDNVEEEKMLEDYLTINLIDQNFFDSKKSSAVNFLTSDTTLIKRRDGILELPCSNLVKKYIDKPNAEESMEVFNYIGQFEFLNHYLINGSYYESSAYILVDKTSGEETQRLGEYPLISSDRKHIVCIYANPYETTADLELYGTNGKQIESVMSASFDNWMPTGEPGNMFWSTDGSLYLSVKHVSAFLNQDKTSDIKSQYLRLRITNRKE